VTHAPAPRPVQLTNPGPGRRCRQRVQDV